MSHHPAGAGWRGFGCVSVRRGDKVPLDEPSTGFPTALPIRWQPDRRRPQTLRLTNNDWAAADNGAAIENVSIAAQAFALPAGSEDAAFLAELMRGTYTVQVSGAPGSARNGISLIEIYAP